MAKGFSVQIISPGINPTKELTMLKQKLTRILNGLSLLQNLLEEEFACLQNQQMEKVTSLEDSIQTLLEQLEVEKRELRDMGIKHGYANLPSFYHYLHQDPELKPILSQLVDKEKQVKKLSAKNQAFVLGLANQVESLLKFLKENVQKLSQNHTVYTRQGRLQGYSV